MMIIIIVIIFSIFMIFLMMIIMSLIRYKYLNLRIFCTSWMRITWRMWEHKRRQEPSANQALCRPAHHNHHHCLHRHDQILGYQILINIGLYIDALLVQNPLHACRSVESKLWSPLKWRTSWGRRLFLKENYDYDQISKKIEIRIK